MKASYEAPAAFLNCNRMNELDSRVRGNDGGGSILRMANTLDSRMRGNDGDESILRKANTLDSRVRGNDDEVDSRVRGNDDQEAEAFKTKLMPQFKTQLKTHSLHSRPSLPPHGVVGCGCDGK